MDSEHEGKLKPMMLDNFFAVESPKVVHLPNAGAYSPEEYSKAKLVECPDCRCDEAQIISAGGENGVPMAHCPNCGRTTQVQGKRHNRTTTQDVIDMLREDQRRGHGRSRSEATGRRQEKPGDKLLKGRGRVEQEPASFTSRDAAASLQRNSARVVWMVRPKQKEFLMVAAAEQGCTLRDLLDEMAAEYFGNVNGRSIWDTVS